MNAKLRFLPHGLQPQDAPRVQSDLFTLEPRTEPRCEHFATQFQQRFDGGWDRVCIICGDVVHP